MLAAFDYGDIMGLCVIDENSKIVFTCQTTDLVQIGKILSYFKPALFVYESSVSDDTYTYQVKSLVSQLPPATKVISVRPTAWKYATESKTPVLTKHFIEVTRLALYSIRRLKNAKL